MERLLREAGGDSAGAVRELPRAWTALLARIRDGRVLGVLPREVQLVSGGAGRTQLLRGFCLTCGHLTQILRDPRGEVCTTCGESPGDPVHASIPLPFVTTERSAEHFGARLGALVERAKSAVRTRSHR